MSVQDIEQLLRAVDVAELLALSPATVVDYAESGRLPSFKVGRALRFRASEVEEFIQSCRRPLP